MAATLVGTNLFGFADGNSPGHDCSLGTAPNVGEFDILGVNSDTTVSTPSGFSVATSNVNAQGAYLFYRKAVGGEATSVTIVTSGNFNCQVSHSRWSGLLALDVTNKASTVGSAANSSIAVSTGALTGTSELVIMFAALASIGTTANQATPVWSTGFTGATGFNPFGTGSSGMSGLVGYKDGTGTAAESPSVSWSNDAVFNRDSLVAAFTESSASTVTMDATGASTLGGSAALTDTKAIAATGVSAYGGAAALTETKPLAGTGASTYSGTASMLGSTALNASGATVLAGTATMTRTAGLVATGASTYGGAGDMASPTTAGVMVSGVAVNGGPVGATLAVGGPQGATLTMGGPR